jgi:proteic killer suppression protein
VIKSFAHKGLEAFFKTGGKAGIQPSHAARLRRQLAQLDKSSTPTDMNIPGWKLHPLKGALAGHWSVWVSGNWRMTFKFDGADMSVVDYQDDH